jgi:hypothetical protein
MKKINYYCVEVADPSSPGVFGSDKKFEAREFNVIGENERYIAIDDYAFTSIRKEKCDWDVCLEKPSIRLNANDSVYGTRVTYRLYTERTKRAATIKKEIEAAIEKKYGFFARGFDLSFITDKEVA